MTENAVHIAPTRAVYDSARVRPSLTGSLVFLVSSFPLGILWFVVLVTLIAVGIGTAVIWVGLALLALALLLWRGGAVVERARVYALLDAYVAVPYRALPKGKQKLRWKARLSDSATWRDLAYLILLFPLGIVEFVLMVASWSAGLGLIGLPIYYRFLPGGVYHFLGYEPAYRWITVDSAADALPFAALGMLVLAIAVALTRGLAAAHARFARAMLGPRERDAVAG